MAHPLLLGTAVLTGSLLLLSGCSWDNPWKSTKEFYRTYINAPASIDYEDQGTLTDAESSLAAKMVGIDIQLEQLEQFLQNADRPPSPEIITLFFQRFPWISGLAAVNTEGALLAREPEYSMKELDFAAMLQQEARKGEMRGLRGMVQDSPLGGEVLVGVPVYRDADMQGMLIAHFDMRGLLSYTSGADDLIILAPQATLWSGRFTVENTPLAGQDWASITKSSSEGRLSDSRGDFLWIVRYIGKQPLIFATPAKVMATTAPSAGKQVPVTEDKLLDQRSGSLLLAPVPDLPDFGAKEQSISK